MWYMNFNYLIDQALHEQYRYNEELARQQKIDNSKIVKDLISDLSEDLDE